MKKSSTLKKTLFIFVTLLSVTQFSFSQSCDPSTPTFTFDLSGNPDSVWVSPSVVRSGLCCGLDPTAKPPIRCVEFFFTLDEGAQGIRFDIASGAIPPGALGYQINCGPVIQVGEMICLSGPGPHRLTFCKPGNNPNTYSITSIPKPAVSDPQVVSDACTGIITATDFDPASITWTSVPANPIYNSYLSCTAGCTTTIVTYQPGAPAFIDYEVSGYPIGGCSIELVKATTRVYFVTDIAATIMPQDPVVCFGGTNTTITANGSGGAPPYYYRWNTGETTQTISVGVGTYWVEISDSTNCPRAFDTVTVTAFLSPITANAGPDTVSCANNPNVNLNGSVYEATGGIWSGGNGTYSPDNTSLTALYTPTAAEISAGSVQHILTTTGNRGCPASSDTVVVTIVPTPIVNAGADQTVCANNATLTLNGSVAYAGGGTWSGGAGVFTPGPNSLNATYTPSAAEIIAGTVTLTLTSTGNGTCLPVSDQLIITITPAPIVNAGPDQTICANNATTTLNGTVSAPATGGVWSGGAGLFSPGTTTLNATYTPSVTEITNGTISLILTSTGNGLCNPVRDTMSISVTPAPTSDAGPDQTVCANNSVVTLAGNVTIATGGTWSGGTGIFNPDRNTGNASYTPSASEASTGSVVLTFTTTGNGNCLAVSDQTRITITPAPIVDAGPDQSVCANNATVALNGSVTIASGGSWSGGTGAFSPNANTLNATYTPSAADILAGSVVLTLLSTGNGNCIAVTDQKIITITPAPIVNAGADQSICANNAVATLTGTVSAPATGGIWSGGNGNYSPNSTTLTSTYRPTTGEITSGSVTLTLTSTGNGNCLPVTDQVIITVTTAPTVNAGPDVSICANNATTALAGSVTIATGGAWTGGTGIFNPDRNTTTASYTPSATEITTGSVLLTLTTTGNGNCIAVSDQVRITITPAPVVSAGADQTVCGNTTSVALTGSVTVSSGGLWSSTGSGTIISPTSLTTNYQPSAADITATTVTITLTSTGNGNCLAVSDDLVITFMDVPTVDAGANQTVCTNNFPVQLNATGNPGEWSGGSGTFQPNVFTMNATYTPSISEITAQTVTLRFTTTANGPCTAVFDEVTITIPPGPTANGGGNQTVCADLTGVSLGGTVTVATGGIWTTSGTGSFSDATDLNGTYFPSIDDKTAGSVTLTLTSTNNGSCNPPATDQIVITITPAPTVNAGPDVTVCADTSGLPLNGLVTVATGGEWSTLGTGTFNNVNSQNAVYDFSDADTTVHSVTLVLTTTGNGTCQPVKDTLNVTIVPKPIVNAGLDQTVCADSPSATLTGLVYNATGGQWSSSGTGTFSPNAFSLNAIYYPSAGDRLTGTVNITLTSTGNGSCRAASGSSLILSIEPAPSANAGTDQVICADSAGVSLLATLTVATTGKWTTSGTGSFAPNDSSLSAVYIPSLADVAAGNVVLTITTTGDNCINVSDALAVTITPAPTVNAGIDQTVCANNSDLILNGSVTTATGGVWSGGNGSFSDVNNLNSGYSPTGTEITNGSLQLILTSTGNGTCKLARDTMTVTITDAPTVHAGPDQVLCMDQNTAALSGSVNIATGGTWTTNNGTGIFSPASTTLSTSYLPTATDKATGSVNLILTSTGNGNCLAVRDTIVVSFSLVPTVDAGPASACSDDAAIVLNGSITIATTSTWSSSGTGSFSPSPNQLNASYVPSSADRNAGVVKIYLTATTCKTITDSVVLNIVPAPEALAGQDQTVCANNSLTKLSGTVNHSGGGIWSSSGSGQFTPDNTSINATYTPSAADIINGSATLVLTTTGNGNCRPSSDTLRIAITPAPTTNAGTDQAICADLNGVSLSGSVTIATGVNWTSNGTGSFSPSSNALNPSYVPSASDKTSGNIILTITTTGNGNCLAVSDNMALTITPAPTISAGPDLTACEDVNAVAFFGSVTVATGGSWTASGSGGFSDANALHTIYNLTAADKTNGYVTLILTSTGNGLCMAVKDTVILNLTALPISNAGSDQTVCNGNTGIDLNGIITGASGGTWSSSGAGSFAPFPTQLNAIYVPTPSDTAAGSITLTLTTNVIGGCSVFDSINITFIAPRLNLSGHYCFENNLLIQSNPIDTIPGGSFSWYMNDALINGQNNADITVNQRGIYSVQYTFDQCTIEDSTNVTLPIELETEDKLVCEGGTTTLTTTLVPKSIYEWTHQGVLLSGNTNTITVTDDGNPMYIVKGIDTLLCENIDTVLVNTVPPPTMTLVNTPSCVGDSVTINAIPSNDTDPVNSTYTWFFNDATYPATSSTITVKNTGEYKVIYTLGECTAADSSLVTFHPLPVPFNKPYVNFCKELAGSTTLDAGPAFSYLWLASSNTLQTETVTNAGLYFVQIWNEFNCSATDSIKVNDICPPRLFVPNVFSPNGDGQNDLFTISGAHFKNLKLTIFNRWGEVIFYTEDRNLSWDGMYREEAMPIGVYPWVVSYEGEFEEFQGPYKLEGSVTITK